MSTNKSATYSILIPPFASSCAPCESLDPEKCRTFGYQGENLRFWLVAESMKSEIDDDSWSRESFVCEVANVNGESTAAFHSPSTAQIKQAPDQRKTGRGKRNALMVPLEIQLPNVCGTADIAIWRSDYSSMVVAWTIKIELPMKLTCTFGTRGDKIRFGFEFIDSEFDADEYDLHFAPNSNVSLSMLEDAFVLQRALDEERCYYLSLRTNAGLRLLNDMKLNLAVVWGDSSMLSSFDVRIPFPSGPLGLTWAFPKLKRLKQTSISLELTNISNSEIGGKVELEETCIIPLEKSLSFGNLKPNEKRVLTFPCIPRTCGTFVLNYVVEINQEKFKPIFQTIISIE